MKYHLPTQILFGRGMVSELGHIVNETLRSERPLLVTDAGVKKAGIAEGVLRQLPDVPTIDNIEPNPRHTTVDEGGEIARKIRPDCVIALGGGSVLDAAKAIALLATNPGCIEDYEGREKYREAPLRVLAVPTTCGTGSEVTWVAVITHTGRKFKMSIKGPLMYPAVALVDPDLLMTLPPQLVAATGLDALTHAVEAFTVRPATFVTDTLALEAARLIFRFLQEAYDDIAANERAREGIMRGSLFAGMAFGNSDVGAVHCLAESIGSLYDTAHGVANAVLLPYVMEFNLVAAADKYAEIAAAAGIEADGSEEAGQKLIQKIKDISRELKIPVFRELEIPEDEFPLIAQKSFENNSNPSNAREAGMEDYMNILRRAHQEEGRSIS